MRHIKYIAAFVTPGEKVPEGASVKVVITEQTHIGRLFGSSEGGYVELLGGVRLMSSGYPHMYGPRPEHKCDLLVTVRGTDFSRNDETIYFNAAEYLLFKEAVVAYNLKYQ